MTNKWITNNKNYKQKLNFLFLQISIKFKQKLIVYSSLQIIIGYPINA